MTRAIRAALVAVFAVGLAAVGVSASQTQTPSIASLNRYWVQPGVDLVLSGNAFSSDVVGTTSDCTFAGLPTVHFYPLVGGGPLNVQPAGTDGGHCSNTQVHVAVPGAITGAARVSISDPQGHESNGNLVVTMAPGVSVSPSAGQVGTHPSVVGSGLHPASLASNPAPKLTLGSSQRNVLAWSDTAVQFDPANTSGTVQFSYYVFNDLNAQQDQSKWTQIQLNAGNYSFLPPQMSSAGVGPSVVGDRVNLPGQNLGGSTGSVTFPGTQASVTPYAWGSGGVGVTIPAGAQPGQLQVYVPGYGPIPGPSISLNPKPTGMSPTAGSAGQQVQVSGYNFGNSTGSVSLGGTSVPVNAWSDRNVAFTISPDSDGGAVTVTRADGAAAGVASLAIVPRLDRIESPSVTAGAQVVVDGVSFGANQGKATLGSQDVQPLLWSRQSVLVQLPVAISPGSYPLTVTDTSGEVSNALNLTIVAAPSPTPGKHGASPTTSATGAPLGVDGALAPSFDNNHDFVKPIKPPSPVYFNITTDPHKVRAGEEAGITVTLKLNDKPVKGAEIKLAMLFTPGSDYKFMPDSGVTDENGVFTAKVRVSKTPGDSVIAATSGVFSDQDHVAGAGADGKTVAASQAAPTPNGGFAPLLVLGVVALLLVGAGFYLNVRSMGS